MKRIILICCLLIAGNSFAFAQHVTVSGKINSLTDGDSVLLTLNNVGEPFISNNIDYRAVIKKKSFLFKIPFRGTIIHLSIRYIARNSDPYVSNKLNSLALDNYYIEPGDNISIVEHAGKYQFYGKGAGKFNIISTLNAMQEKVYTGIKWGDPGNTKLYFLKHDTALIERMRLIRSNKKRISESVYFLLSADVLGDYLNRGGFVSSMLPKSLISIAEEDLKGYKSIVPKALLNFGEINKQPITKLSGNYSLGIIVQYKLDSCTYRNKLFSINKCFQYILKNFSGAIRQRLILTLIYLERDSAGSLYPYINKANDLLSYVPFKQILTSLRSNRIAGADAYHFNLPDTSGKFHTLREFKGKVILLDFWFTGCGSCLQSAPFVRQVEEHFEGMQVAFVTINLDKQKGTWINSIKGHHYTGLGTINLFTQGLAFDHRIVKYYMVNGCPTFILIDANGKVLPNPENPRFDNGAQLTSLIEKALKSN